MLFSAKIDSFSKATALLLLFCPILKTYGFETFDFSIILISIFIGIFLLKKGFRNSMPRWLTIYFGYNILTLILSFNITLMELLRILYVLLAYMMFFHEIELNKLFKCYKVLAAVCIAFFFLQEVSFYATGHRINGLITFLPLSLNVDDVSTFFDKRSIAGRSSSFFSEPAHFVQFLLPLFAIFLFDERKNNYRWLAIIFVTLLLLQSGNALIGLLAIFSIYTCKILGGSLAKIKIGTIICGILLLAIGIVYANSAMGGKLQERQNQINGKMELSSGFVRVVRGYYVFDAGSFANQIFGTNSKAQIKSRIRQSKVAFFFQENDMYFNLVQTVLIKTGYVGALIFGIMILSLWRKNNYQGKAILLAFTALSFTASLYFSMTMALYLVLAQKIKEQSLCEIKFNNT